MAKYVYDTHLHTAEGSACASMPGEAMAQAYRDAGYTGIVVTNHFYHGNTAVDRKLPWHEWVEQFCKGYENAKARGDEIGLQVFFAWEAGYRGTEFLIYGLDKQWLLEHPEIRDCSIEEQYELVHAHGGLVIHAHPFREAPYIQEIRLLPEYVDGVEVINATHSSVCSKSHKNPHWNDMAMDYARAHNLAMTAGSDQHHATMIGGGMVFGRKLKDIRDFCEAVRNAEALQLLDGTKPLSELED